MKLSKKDREKQIKNFDRLAEKLAANKEKASLVAGDATPEKQNDSSNKIETDLKDSNPYPQNQEKPKPTQRRKSSRRRNTIKKDVTLSFLQPFEEAKKFDHFIYSNFQQYGQNNINKKRIVRALMRTVDLLLDETAIDDIYETIPHDLKDADLVVEELEKIIRKKFEKAK